ncbi:MAG: DNA polymerase III subunit beta [Candidatus Falkowbacteria bacterium]|nr:DNA polymerase III subunit beta [Candidatus Falkowbacteria bacterium]
MKFIIRRENLKKGLSIVGHITTKSINLPILNNVLIKANSSGVELVSTNLEIGIVHRLRGKVEEDGEFTVDSKMVSEYVNFLAGDNVDISESNEELKIECDNYKTKIKGENAKEFPLIPTLSGENFCLCDIEDLKRALSRVIFAVSTNENRIELSGVLFSFFGSRLVLASTDSYRLAEKEITIDWRGVPIEDQKFIVPAKTIQEFLRMISNFSESDSSEEKNNQVKIFISDNQIMFSVGSTDLVSRLINGNFPDYRQIVPEKFNTSVILSRGELLRAVKAASIFSKSGINDVGLEFKGDKLVVYSSSGQSGESRIELSCEKNGNDNEITVNFRYLLDGLNNIGDEEINLKVISDNSPCMLSPTKEENYFYIVMPIRQ